MGQRLRRLGGLMRRAGSAMGRMAVAVDARDAVLVAGLLLVGAGLWMVWLPLALVVPGAVLVYVAIWGAGLRGEDRWES
ncbi:MAG: hypothetical protein AB7P12_16380 [Alphaproteobacteria bacterium]